jgi:hypothetical protein
MGDAESVPGVMREGVADAGLVEDVADRTIHGQARRRGMQLLLAGRWRRHAQVVEPLLIGVRFAAADDSVGEIAAIALDDDGERSPGRFAVNRYNTLFAGEHFRNRLVYSADGIHRGQVHSTLLKGNAILQKILLSVPA